MHDLVTLLRAQHRVPSEHETVSVTDRFPEGVGITSKLQLIHRKTPRQWVDRKVPLLPMAGRTMQGIESPTRLHLTIP